MLSAPVGIVALGLLFVRMRSNEPTQSLFARWPDQPQISKCEVRPATPLEISQGAQFGLTIQTVLPANPRQLPELRYSIREPAPKSSLSKTSLKGLWRETHVAFCKAAHPLQQDYSMWEKTESFNRRVLKSADGIIEVDFKAFLSTKPSPLTDKVFRLDTKQIPFPDAIAARKANFQVTQAVLTQETAQKGVGEKRPYNIFIRFELKDVIDESQGLLTQPQIVGKWVMEGPVSKTIEAETPNYVTIGPPKTVKAIGIVLLIPNLDHSPQAGTKFRGLISINRGWPQEITLTWPKNRTFKGTNFPKLKFNAQLAPLPK